MSISTSNGEMSTRGRHPIEDVIYERIVDAVIDKRLRPGERLNEAKLAVAYKVPRSRVRRVLQRLTAEGLVEFELHRGAFVSLPSVQEAHDVFEARLHVEAAVARVACQRIEASGIRELRAHLELEHRAFTAREAGVNRVAGDFHVLLADVSGNRVLADILRPLVRRFCIIQSLYERASGVLCLVDEHTELVDLIEAGQAEDAAAAAIAHCRHIYESLDLSETRLSAADIYDAGL